MFQMLRKQTLVLFMLATASLFLGSCDGQAQMSGPDHRYVLRADLEEIRVSLGEGKSDEEILDDAMAALVPRLESLGIHTYSINHDGTDLITLETSGARSGEALARVLHLDGGQLDFRLVDMSALPENTANGIASAGSEILPVANEEDSQIAVRVKVAVSGHRIINATASTDPLTKEPGVMLQFDDQGTAQLAELTRAHIGHRMAVVLDGVVLSTPTIHEPIEQGHMMVSGGFTEESANQLAIAVLSGALSTPFEIVEASPVE